MTNEKKPSTDEDILSRQNTGCPYHTQQKLRTEHGTDGQPAEIIWSTSLGAWMPLSYRLIKQVAIDHKHFLNSEVFGKHSTENIPQGVSLLISMDGEEHAAKKKHVQGTFKTEEVGRWEPTARTIVQRQLDYVIKKDDKKMEVVYDLSIPVPIEIICEVLGMPGENRVRTIKEHTDAVVSFIGHAKGDRFTEREERFDRENRFTVPEFVMGHAEDKRRNPDGKMLSSIVNDDFPIGGIYRKMDNVEITSDTALLLFTGNITTTSLIAFAFYHLALNPEVMKEVQQDYNLIDKVINEVVRLEAPAQATYRVAANDVVLGGIQIKKGDSLYIPWSAAGRDPEKYENADTFDIHRKEQGNLSFGIGKHRCIGEKLAWMEAKITLEESLDRFGSLAIPPGHEPELTDMPLFRGFRKLENIYTLR